METFHFDMDKPVELPKHKQYVLPAAVGFFIEIEEKLVYKREPEDEDDPPESCNFFKYFS